MELVRITSPFEDAEAMIADVNAIFGTLMLPAEMLTYATAAEQGDADISAWNFHTYSLGHDGETKVGFWVPALEQKTIGVKCPNYYTNEAVDLVTFGHTMTVVAVSKIMWDLYHNGREQECKKMILLHDALQAMIRAKNPPIDALVARAILD